MEDHHDAQRRRYPDLQIPAGRGTAAFKQWARVNTVIFTMLAGMLVTSLAIASSAGTLPQVAASSTTLPK
jgi:hypothetical protein